MPFSLRIEPSGLALLGSVIVYAETLEKDPVFVNRRGKVYNAKQFAPHKCRPLSLQSACTFFRF